MLLPEPIFDFMTSRCKIVFLFATETSEPQSLGWFYHCNFIFIGIEILGGIELLQLINHHITGITALT